MRLNAIDKPQKNIISPLATLKKVFGYASFQGMQETIINHLLQHKDCLVVMPTGSGKSICYQLPSLLRDGTGIIISPLIALMQNQVGSLLQNGIKAAFINSTLPEQEIQTVEQQLLNNKLDLLYIAPERLMHPRMLNTLKNATLALFAIDEAHCVSMWGHDFRPEYQQLSILKKLFADTPRIALTATANKETREEIQSHLGITKSFVAGFDRPNIRYQISEHEYPRQALLDFIQDQHSKETGIVYCLSRANVERNAEWLRDKGLNAYPYHAGLSAEIRKDTLDKFLTEEDIIIVATVAFGMGIDKPNVRFVAHLNLPKSIEAYYQETGRAGRDGLPADAWMSYGYQDILLLQRMIETGNASEQRKLIEQHKLESLLGFCEVTTCRRQVLLNYFSEDNSKPCGNCDTCLEPIATWDGTEASKKALSCIYRTRQKYGARYLIDVLLAAVNPKIKTRGHTEISTYGIGKDLTQKQWLSVFRQLIIKNLVTVDNLNYGSLKLNENSRNILSNKVTLTLRKDIKFKSWQKRKSSFAPDVSNQELWYALKDYRTKQADKQNIAPYFIFNDATLLELTKKQPTKTGQLFNVTGLGHAKIRKYGKKIISLIATHKQ